MFGNIFEKFQQMQEEMKLLKERMEKVTVTGQAGDGKVTVEVKGNQQIVAINIADNLSLWEKEELEDLIIVATNRALEQVKKMYEAEMANLAKEFLPPGMPPGLMGMN